MHRSTSPDVAEAVESVEVAEPGVAQDLLPDSAEPERQPSRQASRTGGRRVSVPWDAVPSPHAKRAKAAAAQTVAVQRRRREAEAQSRRRRTVAVLSAAGILAGGGGWVAVNSAASNPAPAPTGAGSGEVAPEEAARWADQAQVVLASVTQQLDVVAQAQEAWNKRPESRSPGTPPAPVAQMLERKALLEQQRATLESQLAAWRSLDKVNGELATADQQLAAVQKAMESLPQGEQVTSEQAATVKQLAEQRDVRIRQRDAKQQELDSLKTGVHNAVVTPLQDTSDKTKALADTVLGLVNGQAPSKQNGPDHEPTPGVANRDSQNRQRQDTNNSAPLVPGRTPAGASPNPGGAAQGAAGAVGGAVDGVADAAGSLLSRGREAVGSANGDQSHTAAANQSGAPEQTKAKADKTPAVERQIKDSRGTTPRSGRLGWPSTGALPGAGGFLPGPLPAGGLGSDAVSSATGVSGVGALQPRTASYDPQSQVPAPRPAASTTPTTTPQAASLNRGGAMGMARGVMPPLMPGAGAASMLAAGAAPTSPASSAPASSLPASSSATPPAPAAPSADSAASADSAQPQSNRKVTVDQLVDYAWQRAMDEAESRRASGSTPATAAATTAPSGQQPAADQVPAQYQELVSAWSSGR